MKGIHFILFFFLYNIILGQDHRIIVVNDSTLEPVPYATCVTSKNSFYVDAFGQFPSQEVLGQKLMVRCLGYETKELIIDQNIDTIFLFPKKYLLKEVTINANPQVEEFGYHKYNTNSYQTGNVENMVGVKIEGNGKNSKIEKIIVEFKKISKGYPFNIYIFEVSKRVNNEGTILVPGDLIFSKRITHNTSKNKSIVDLSKEHLFFKEAIVVGLKRDLNTIKRKIEKKPIFNTGGVKITYEYAQTNSYIFVKNHWVLFPGPDDESWNFKIGIEVKQ